MAQFFWIFSDLDRGKCILLAVLMCTYLVDVFSQDDFDYPDYYERTFGSKRPMLGSRTNATSSPPNLPWNRERNGQGTDETPTRNRNHGYVTTQGSSSIGRDRGREQGGHEERGEDTNESRYLGREASGNAGYRPSYDSDAERRRFGSDGSHDSDIDRSDYGSGRDRPSYVGDRNGPGYGSDRDRPGYSSDRDRSGYSSDRDRSGYSSDRDRSGYSSDRTRPGYSNGRDRSDFGSDRDRSDYGSDRDRPDYGRDRYRPGYGSDRDRSNYGTDRDRPGYGSDRDQPYYNSDGSRPADTDVKVRPSNRSFSESDRYFIDRSSENTQDRQKYESTTTSTSAVPPGSGYVNPNPLAGIRTRYNSPTNRNPQNRNTNPRFRRPYSRVGSDPNSRRRYKSDPRYPDDFYGPDDDIGPGVMSGWRPDLQGACRPGCETLDLYVTVHTSYGSVQGFYVYIYDGPGIPLHDRPGNTNVDRIKGKVSVFMGIPYAQPPVREGRFRPPRPHQGWLLHQGVEFPPACPQPERLAGKRKGIEYMDEDCLYLNIFSPWIGSGISRLYPVMVYIHGGEFMHGTANNFPGHQLAFWSEVVVVAINYRLGALGFLSTGNEASPGNYGMLDQAMALKWIYNNIKAFNGDKEYITLFGPGAGAASAGLLMVSPKTRHMVRGVIAESGSPLADWGAIIDKYRVMNTSLIYAEKMGCTTKTPWKLVDCLREGRSFLELANMEFEPDLGLFPWGPVVQKNISLPGDHWFEEWNQEDWMFLPETPEYLIRNKYFHSKLHYLTGVTRDEASYLLYNNKSMGPYYEVDQQFFDMKIWEFVKRYNYTLNPEGIFNAIRYMYTYWPDPHNKTHIREEYINFLSDYLFRAPVDKTVKLLVEKKVPVYMYVLNTTTEALNLPYWRQIPHELIEYYFFTGAPFMDPELYPEKVRLNRELWTEGDRNMSEFFIFALTNFSRHGSPTPIQILGINWEMATYGSLLYLNVNTSVNSSTMWNYRQRECAMWTEYLPTVIGHLVPTYPPTTEYWWEPESPIQIAFWSVASACVLFLFLTVICCLLWRNAKRSNATKKKFYKQSLGERMPEVYDVVNRYAVSNQMDQTKEDASHLEEKKNLPSSYCGEEMIHVPRKKNNFHTARSQDDISHKIENRWYKSSYSQDDILHLTGEEQFPEKNELCTSNYTKPQFARYPLTQRDRKDNQDTVMEMALNIKTQTTV